MKTTVHQCMNSHVYGRHALFSTFWVKIVKSFMPSLARFIQRYYETTLGGGQNRATMKNWTSSTRSNSSM